MKLLRVPHYHQGGNSDCQAACAAMVMDYMAHREDGGGADRLSQLLDQFSFGYRPEAGHVPPAITGLVSMVIGKHGFAVEFYSRNPDGGGVEGLDFLREGWNFTQPDVEGYAELATTKLTNDVPSALTIHQRPASETEIELAIAASTPVVAIVDLEILKSWKKSANHAVVITGIDETSVFIHDPADPTPHKQYSRKLFFEAHFREKTDFDAYVVSKGDCFMGTCHYDC